MASQLQWRTSNNALYDWLPAAANTSYVPDGLNRYATVAGTTYAYSDGRGNMTSDGTNFSSSAFSTSSTLSMATGLLRPDAGTAKVHGLDVWRDPLAAKRMIGNLADDDDEHDARDER